MHTANPDTRECRHAFRYRERESIAKLNSHCRGTSSRLTIMVTLKIISRYSKGGAPGPGVSRKISGGPLYPQPEVLELLAKKAVEVRPITQACIDDVGNLKLSSSQLNFLLKTALTTGQYLNAQWCGAGKPGVWAACDAYKLVWNSSNPVDEDEPGTPLYVKFCIGKTGLIMLLISCHTSDHWEAI